MNTQTLAATAGETLNRHCGNTWITPDGIQITINGTDEFIVSCICNKHSSEWATGMNLRETVSFIRNHESR